MGGWAPINCPARCATLGTRLPRATWGGTRRHSPDAHATKPLHSDVDFVVAFAQAGGRRVPVELVDASPSLAGRHSVPAALSGTYVVSPVAWYQPSSSLSLQPSFNNKTVNNYLSFTDASGGAIGFHLPVDPLLATGPALPPLGLPSEDDPPSVSTGVSTVIAEGLPPLPTKLIERIRRWEYVDLAFLLDDHRQPESFTFQPSGCGQILVIDQEQAQRRRRQITDILSWLKAFSCYMAVLTSADSTTPTQATGLIAHLHLILQLSQELGPQWMKYDVDFRQWAAARNVRQWGELNFTIYGHCLSAQQRLASSSSHTRPTQQSSGSRKSSNPSSKEACFRWNFKGRCDRMNCPYSHSCWLCGGPHPASSCTTAPKRSK